MTSGGGTPSVDRGATVRALHDAALELERATTEVEACRFAVTAAEEVLDLSFCYVGLVEDGEIVPVAFSSNAGPDAFEALPIDHGFAGKTLTHLETYVVDDILAEPDAVGTSDRFRAGISVPVGDVGVFQAVSTEVGVYDETDLDLAETLASHLGATITRLRTEHELRRQNERLDAFASVVAHDMRNRLSVVDGNIDLAARTGEDHYLDRARDATARMSALLEDLLELARAGRVVDDFQPTPLTAVVERVTRSLDAQPTVTIEADLVVEADEGRLVQLVENLLVNAVTHAGPDATVTVGPLDGEGFFVADDGPGIPEADRETVFEPGYTTEAAGTGFGLDIVRTIAEAHGWTVAVAESASGGARFEVRGVTVVE